MVVLLTAFPTTCRGLDWERVWGLGLGFPKSGEMAIESLGGLCRSDVVATSVLSVRAATGAESPLSLVTNNLNFRSNARELP